MMSSEVKMKRYNVFGERNSKNWLVRESIGPKFRTISAHADYEEARKRTEQLNEAYENGLAAAVPSKTCCDCNQWDAKTTTKDVGHCKLLRLLTVAEFGCNKLEPRPQPSFEQLFFTSSNNKPLKIRLTSHDGKVSIVGDCCITSMQSSGIVAGGMIGPTTLTMVVSNPAEDK